MELHQSHPAHPEHPSHPDNHPHRAHHPHSHNLRVILGVFIVFTIIIMFLFGMLSGAPFGAVVLAFSPVLLLAVISLSLIGADRFDTKYVALLLGALLVLAGAAYPVLVPGLDVAAVLGLNIILGALLILVLAISHQDRPRGWVVESVKEEQEFPEVIATIEDRCKAINFVIGRVYSVHHGSTAGMRERIKIDSEWYNEVSSAMEDPDHNQDILRGVIERIRVRLEQMKDAEKDVFTESQVARLKALDRDPKGRTRIIDVLEENDSDPVGQFHASALEYCELALDSLND